MAQWYFERKPKMTTFANPAQWLLDLFGSKGKVRSTGKSILETAPFWYGINKISGNVGTLPLNVYRDLNPGSEKDKSHVAHRLLRKRPNAYQTPMVFKQTETARAINWGNSRSYIHRQGNRSELLPMRPDATITGMIDGEKWHATKPDKDDRVLTIPDLLQSMKDNPKSVVMVPDADCLHVQGFGNGIVGLSLWEVARNSVEASLGSDQKATKQMTKGFAGKVMLEAPAESQVFRDAKQAEEFLNDFKQKHGDDGAADAIGLLRGGVKANVLNMSNRDAEFVASRNFQRQDAALWLMLETILGDNSSVSYNSEEQKQLAYLKNCLSNWLVRWEEECSFKLLSANEFYSGSHYVKFNIGSLLRTDLATTIDTFSKAIASRIYSPNEARLKLDENPYDGGDSYENPAITPGPSGGDGEPNAALLSHLEHMMRVEERRVNERLERGDSIDQIDSWYEGWTVTLGNTIENLGGDRVLAQNHCVRSLEYIKNKNPSRIDLSGSAELIVEEMTHETV